MSAPPWPYFCFFSCGSKTSVSAPRTSTQWRPSTLKPLRPSSGPSCTAAPWSPPSSPVTPRPFKFFYIISPKTQISVSLNYKTKPLKIPNYISAHSKISKYVLNSLNPAELSLIPSSKPSSIRNAAPSKTEPVQVHHDRLHSDDLHNLLQRPLFPNGNADQTFDYTKNIVFNYYSRGTALFIIELLYYLTFPSLIIIYHVSLLEMIARMNIFKSFLLITEDQGAHPRRLMLLKILLTLVLAFPLLCGKDFGQWVLGFSFIGNIVLLYLLWL